MELRNTTPMKLLSVLLGLGAAGATVILVCFDPSQHGFYPQCMFHQVTGYLCPGCGSLRAMHQLLRGNVTAAWHLNPLFVGLLPLLGGYGLTVLWRRHMRHQLAPEFRLGWLWTGVAIILVFGIVRNLPLAQTVGLKP
jgi:hypothetical protein